jgi:hypothetical protein
MKCSLSNYSKKILTLFRWNALAWQILNFSKNQGVTILRPGLCVSCGSGELFVLPVAFGLVADPPAMCLLSTICSSFRILSPSLLLLLCSSFVSVELVQGLAPTSKGARDPFWFCLPLSCSLSWSTLRVCRIWFPPCWLACVAAEWVAGVWKQNPPFAVLILSDSSRYAAEVKSFGFGASVFDSRFLTRFWGSITLQ